MSLGLVGKKCGMTRVFTEAGVSIPVTVIEIVPNRVAQIKTSETDGYSALQVAVGSRRSSRVNKAAAGHFAKANIEAGAMLKEFRVDSADLAEKELGTALTVDLFKEGEKVDISGLTRGKGYAGTVKRHNFRTQDATHGNSLSHRAPGSIGQCQTPGRVLKGKRMAGHMGDVYRTIQNQEIIRVDAERQLLLVKGAIPGAPDGMVVIAHSLKKRKKGKGE